MPKLFVDEVELEMIQLNKKKSWMAKLSVTEKIEDQKLRDTRIVILLMRRGQFGS